MRTGMARARGPRTKHAGGVEERLINRCRGAAQQLIIHQCNAGLQGPANLDCMVWNGNGCADRLHGPALRSGRPYLLAAGVLRPARRAALLCTANDAGRPRKNAAASGEGTDERCMSHQAPAGQRRIRLNRGGAGPAQPGAGRRPGPWHVGGGAEGRAGQLTLMVECTWACSSLRGACTCTPPRHPLGSTS